MTSTSSRRPDVPRDQASAAIDTVRDVLGPSLLGAYLFGSAVDGGLKPDSDLDLLGVIGRRLSVDERRQIIDGLLPLSGRETRRPAWRPIELTLVVLDEVSPWRYPPRFDLQYGEWLRAHFLAGDLQPWPQTNPDVAMLVVMVIARSEALVGPVASELLEPVPRADILRAMTVELPTLLDDLETDTRNVLLTLARMWMTAETGEVCPKDIAATWAAERLRADDRPILLRARSGYLGEVADRWDDLAAVRPLADALARQIDSAIGRNGRPRLPPADASV